MVLRAQVDTVRYHQLSGVEVVGKARPSVTREGTPLQVMDKAGIERLGVQDLSEAVKRFSGATVHDFCWIVHQWCIRNRTIFIF